MDSDYLRILLRKPQILAMRRQSNNTLHNLRKCDVQSGQIPCHRPNKSCSQSCQAERGFCAIHLCTYFFTTCILYIRFIPSAFTLWFLMFCVSPVSKRWCRVAKASWQYVRHVSFENCFHPWQSKKCGGIVYTVEPPNNGHIGDKSFVHCSEVFPSLEVEWTIKGQGRTVCPL